MKKIAIYINTTWNQNVVSPLKEYFKNKYGDKFDFFIANTLIPNFEISDVAVINNTHLDALADLTVVFLTLTDYNHQKERFRNADKYLVIQPRNDYMFDTKLEGCKMIIFDIENKTIKEV